MSEMSQVLAMFDRLMTGQEVLRGEVAELRREVAELRGEVAELRPLRGEFEALRAEFERLRADVERLRAGQDRLRGDVMARIDRLQDALTVARDEMTVTFGGADQTRRVAEHTRDELRALSEVVSAMGRQLRTVTAQLRELRGDP